MLKSYQPNWQVSPSIQNLKINHPAHLLKKKNNQFKLNSNNNPQQNSQKLSTLLTSTELASPLEKPLSSLALSNKSMLSSNSNNKSFNKMAIILSCWESSPNVTTNNLTTSINTSSQSEAIKDSNTLKKSDSKSEKDKRLKLKLLSKSLLLNKTVSLTDS